MNDLLPPARRSIPEQGRTRMRDKLDAEIHAATTVSRREAAIRRYGLPAVAAVAVGVIAVGGYLLAGTGDDNDRGTEPAGQGGGQGDTAPKREGDQQAKHAGPSTVLTDPGPAYQKCIDLAVRGFDLRGEPLRETPVGKLAIDNGIGTTVVVANSTDSYTCNIKPDNALSRGNALDGTVQESDFWFALNVTSNVLPGAKGEMAWAGGELPVGVSDVTYTFPDGHTEKAVVQDGFWAMQYFSDRWLPTGPNDRVEVALDGSNAQTLELPFTVDTMCNQISHGC
jgi:hypothetical protein